MKNERLTHFTDDELATMAYALGHFLSPIAGDLRDEIQAERLRRISDTAA